MVNKKCAYILMLVLVVAAFLFSLISGTVDISCIDAVKALLGNSVDETKTSIIRHVRFPHSIMACITGAGLAVSGCVFQGILKNPLADPFTLGVSSGAVFGVAIAFISGLATVTSFFVTVCAFLGSLLSTLIVYLLSMYKRFGSNSMVLSGVITSYMFSAAVMLIFALSPATNIQSAFAWLIGTLSIFDERMVLFVAIIVILGSVVLSLSGNIINAVSLGGEKSRTLGINIEGSIKFLFLTASLITAATVSVCGIIGFVGLITPHIMRKIVGTNNVILIPVSAFAGAFFLLTCDTLARTLFKPMVIPVGVITNIIGGSFFVFLLLKRENSIA
ncbi:iron ABC transporter permease [Endomicrobiia bacterium]|nr:iron ABC transporter permease [Endomicrobiia bacterium]